jgi:hypothetical protein
MNTTPAKVRRFTTTNRGTASLLHRAGFPSKVLWQVKGRYDVFAFDLPDDFVVPDSWLTLVGKPRPKQRRAQKTKKVPVVAQSL